MGLTVRFDAALQYVEDPTECSDFELKFARFYFLEDPVRIIEEEETPNSVMKFLQDVFSREDTATTFLYTNDLMVLADIIARNLADLPPGAKVQIT